MLLGGASHVLLASEPPAKVRKVSPAAEQENENFMHVLMGAIQEDSFGAIELLLTMKEKAFDYCTADSNGRTALMYAAMLGREDVCQLLIKKGVDILAKDSNGRTALMYAAISGRKDLYQLLKDNGADTTVQDRDNHMTAAEYAALKAKEVTEEYQRNGETPLMLAIKTESLEAIAFLIENGADIYAQDRTGKTPLIHAVISERSDVCELLRQKDSELKWRQDSNGSTIGWFREWGSDINVQDNVGRTALIYAVISGRSDVCRMLLKTGANILTEDSTGMTAQDHARENGLTKLDTLLSYGINLEVMAQADMLKII